MVIFDESIYSVLIHLICLFLIYKLNIILFNNFFNQSFRNSAEKKLVEIELQRSTANQNFEQLRNHYDALVGRRARAASEVSAQPIQLPSDRSDLDLLVLNLYEENIMFRYSIQFLLF